MICLKYNHITNPSTSIWCPFIECNCALSQGSVYTESNVTVNVVSSDHGIHLTGDTPAGNAKSTGIYDEINDYK